MKVEDVMYGLQRKKRNLTRLSVLATIVVLTLSVLGLANHTAHAASPFTFTNYEVARSWDQSFAGVSCPNSGINCWNFNGEPNIATAPDGTIYITSENTAFNHPSECGNIAASFVYTCGGTGAWKSTDGGAHFTSLTAPNVNFVTGNNPVTIWGGDTHVAVAPVKNSNGQYNVYVVSLEAAGVGLTGVGESTSRDGGKTWSNNPFAIQFTNPLTTPLVTDRPWVAAYGQTEVCISTHDGAAVADVYCSFNAGQTFTLMGPAFDAAHIAYLTAETSIPGAIHIDPNNGNMYVPFSGVANAIEAGLDTPCGSLTGISCPYGNHVVYMAVSTNGGHTFTDHTVYTNTKTGVSYAAQFLAMTFDSAGNLYEVYSDGVSLFYSYSTDVGITWNGPYKVNQASSWAIEPWAFAGDPGKLDIVWYGTNNCDAGVTDVDNCSISTNWQVFFAQNLNAFSNPTGFTQQAATGIIHHGPVCLNGSNCQSYRGLFDDFGVTADPATGMATIVHDNDLYTPNDNQNLPNPDCTRQYTSPTDQDQQNCVHTNIAHQTSGPSISHPPCRESDGEGDFHGTNGNGHFSFDRDGCIDGDRDSIDSSNRGDGKDFHSTEIDSAKYDDTAHTMTVVGLGTVNGLPVIFTFVATETGYGTPGLVNFVSSDGYTNAGPLTNGSIILH
jgi:hypothetical protein